MSVPVKVLRPRKVESNTIQVNTGCGHMYVTVEFLSGKPIGVFASLGKSGGCGAAQNEALGRAISLGLKYGVPPEDFLDELKGVRCPNPKNFPKEQRCLSCAEGVAIALAECLGIELYSNGDGLLKNEETNEN